MSWHILALSFGANYFHNSAEKETIKKTVFSFNCTHLKLFKFCNKNAKCEKSAFSAQSHFCKIEKQSPETKVFYLCFYLWLCKKYRNHRAASACLTNRRRRWLWNDRKQLNRIIKRAPSDTPLPINVVSSKSYSRRDSNLVTPKALRRTDESAREWPTSVKWFHCMSK